MNELSSSIFLHIKLIFCVINWANFLHIKPYFLHIKLLTRKNLKKALFGENPKIKHRKKEYMHTNTELITYTYIHIKFIHTYMGVFFHE